MNKGMSLERANDILLHADLGIKEAEKIKSISTDIKRIKIQEDYIKQFKYTEEAAKEYIKTILAA